MTKSASANGTCPCGSDRDFSACCGPFLASESQAPTAEKLMRSRYVAYTRGDIGYIKRTLAIESQKDFDRAATQEWADGVEWLGLKILSTDRGLEGDDKGKVEFVASYKHDGKILEHHELSQFRKDAKLGWLFVDGEAETYKQGEVHREFRKKAETLVRETPKIGRNDPCSCGSGRKFKKCCGA